MKTILICNDYFFPGFKAGGPIQSIVNLVKLLQKHYRIYILTSSSDLGDTRTYDNISEDKWNKVLLPFCSSTVDVWYASKRHVGYADIKGIITGLQPDIIYLNGLYSPQFFLYPLLISRKLKYNLSVCVCPRGMLQSGALQVKSLKKSMYLKILKGVHLLDNVSWHATNDEEQNDINKYFPNSKRTLIAYNIPKSPFDFPVKPTKTKGKLRLVYLSLITEKKNLHLLLEALVLANPLIELNIYGPIKDDKYWDNKCLPIVNKLKDRVNYSGNIQPDKVQEIIGLYDIFALLTMGENFGHALYESLSIGRPILTSYFTPWNDLAIKKAGWNVDISDTPSIVNKLNQLVTMENSELAEYCEGAHSLALNYYNQKFIESYCQLFN